MIEHLKRKIKSAGDLLSVVKTMKILAAVSIRQYEKALESFVEYNRTVEMGLQVVLKQRPEGIRILEAAVFFIDSTISFCIPISRLYRVQQFLFNPII